MRIVCVQNSSEATILMAVLTCPTECLSGRSAMHCYGRTSKTRVLDRVYVRAPQWRISPSLPPLEFDEWPFAQMSVSQQRQRHFYDYDGRPATARRQSICPKRTDTASQPASQLGREQSAHYLQLVTCLNFSTLVGS